MRKNARAGFTLIELSLSLVFIGILSIMMVLIISNTISSYRRGITLNRINTVGMDLVDDMRSAVQNSTIGSLTAECRKRFPDDNSGLRAQREACIADGGKSFVKMTKYAEVKIPGKFKQESIPVYGVFCTGTYSYIWNSGYFNKKTGADMGILYPATFRYKDSNGNVKNVPESSSSPFRLLKIQDDSRAVCRSRAIVNNKGSLEYRTSNLADETLFDISGEGYSPISEAPLELVLTDSDNDLAIYDLNVADPAESGTQENVFYSASLILGTLEGGVDITEAGRSCAVPTEYENEFFDYCAINNFSFAAQANGK